MPNRATARATNNPAVTDPGSITCQPPHLSIVKTPDGQMINAGDTATFTIVVSNTGTGVAKSVTLTDPLPAGGGVNWTTASAGCSVSGAPGAQSLSCSFGDLAAGASVTVVVSAVTSFQACTTMPNLATAHATNAPDASDPGSITCQPPNLTIVKTPDGATYTAGQTISFTIVVSNGGPGTAKNVHFAPADNLPDPNASLQWAISGVPSCTSGPAPTC